MKTHVPATTRVLEPSRRFCVFGMSRAFCTMLAGHVPGILHVPAGSAEIEPLKSCRGPVPHRSYTGKPLGGTWAPLIYKGAICPDGPN